MNYIFSTIVGSAYLDNKSYQTINDVVGALEGTKLEFYRRQATPHEQIKIHENGDTDQYKTSEKYFDEQMNNLTPLVIACDLAEDNAQISIVKNHGKAKKGKK